MLKSLKAIFNKMSSKADKETLARKLIKSERIVRDHNAVNLAGNVADIEDAAGALSAPSKSQYFSPVQTRHQRKVTVNPPKKLLLNEKKSRVQKAAAEELANEVKPLTIEKMKTAKVGIKKPVKQKQVKMKEVPVNQELNEDINIAGTSASIKLEDSNWKPANWLEMLQNIRKMRTSSLAPVDFMGCDKCADDEADEKTQRFHKLVSLMLSSQTKDETTYEAMQRLKLHTLTPSSIVQMEPTNLENILKPVSFYKNKAKYLQQTARILIDQYTHDIPNNVKELMALPGVGPKMAHICMATAWNEITGIGVDVHVHRISNRMGWLPSETKEPERTRIALEQWLPRALWSEINHLLVGFGQTICTPLQPKCGNCLNNSICPAAFKSSPSKADKTKTIGIKTKIDAKIEEVALKKVNLKKLKMHV